jgi:hypothetical protein
VSGRPSRSCGVAPYALYSWAMGATLDDDLLRGSLQTAIESGIQDIFMLLGGSRAAHQGRVTAWWLAHNIDTVRVSFPFHPARSLIVPLQLTDKYAFLLKVIVQVRLVNLQAGIV